MRELLLALAAVLLAAACARAGEYHPLILTPGQPLYRPVPELTVEVHNCLNRAITGTLGVRVHAELYIEATQEVKLAAGETKPVVFTMAVAADQRPPATNAYPSTFRFESDAGNAEYQEILNVTVAPKRSITVDGSLDDWKDVSGINVVAGLEKADAAENLRRPWLELTTSTACTCAPMAKANCGGCWRRACRACTTSRAARAGRKRRGRCRARSTSSSRTATCASTRPRSRRRNSRSFRSKRARRSASRSGSANKKGPQINYGANKAVCKINGLSLHPYWEPKMSCAIKWTLGE
jgi:hypothetical protein